MKKVLQISQIEIESGTQMRSTIRPEVVDEYSEMFVEQDEWPFSEPLTVFDDGESNYLADGFHRLYAATQAGKSSVLCNVKKGSLRDAIKYALRANSNHGLRRTNEDKRRAVKYVLSDPEWKNFSSRVIADMVGVGHTFVDGVRSVLLASDANRISGDTVKTEVSEIRVGKDGKKRSSAKKPKPQKSAGLFDAPSAPPEPEIPVSKQDDDQTLATHEPEQPWFMKYFQMFKDDIDKDDIGWEEIADYLIDQKPELFAAPGPPETTEKTNKFDVEAALKGPLERFNYPDMLNALNDWNTSRTDGMGNTIGLDEISLRNQLMVLNGWGFTKQGEIEVAQMAAGNGWKALRKDTSPGAKDHSKPKLIKEDADFEEFWGAYPEHKRESETITRIQWDIAISLKPPGFLISAVKRFAVSQKGQGDFCPSSANWLKNKRWKDGKSSWGGGSKEKSMYPELEI